MVEEILIATKYNSPKEFHLTMPLYEEYDLGITTIAEEIFMFLRNQETIDAYCIWCERDSVFETTEYFSVSSPGYGREFQTWMGTDYTNLSIEFTCTRNSNHIYYAYYFKEGHHFTKIGQYPSIADFQIPQAAKYRKILGETLYKEFTKGIGLNAHGVGIGAFVYLRRIFENLIKEAHDIVAKEDASFDEATYRTAKMDDKIQMVSTHLPAFLVENRKLYGVLSKGLHEMTEEECLKYFQTVKIGIEQILDEKIELAEKKAKAEKARQALQGVLQEVSQK